jgi:hypothetical protein
MNLRVRDNLLYAAHRGLALAGCIQTTPLEEIRKKTFNRILIVATTAIGDAILTTPLLESVRHAFPKSEIGFLASHHSTPLFENHPAVNSVLPYYGKYRRVRKTFDALKKGRYELALVANANDPDVIPMIWWSGCRHIIRRPQRYTIYGFMIANPD